MKVTKAYVVNAYSLGFSENVTDEEFIKIAENKGKIYSLDEFQIAFNTQEVDTKFDTVRFITTDYGLKDDLNKVCKQFDEQLASFTTVDIIDEDENGKCISSANAISDEDLDLLRKVYYNLEEIVENL